jgi:hypothetical protein
MKTRPLFLGFTSFLVFVLLLTACSFEIPEKVHITGNPTYTVNLGSSSVKPLTLEEYFGPDDINEIFNKDANEDSGVFKTYEYTGDGDTLTYLLHYKPDPIEINLNTEQVEFNPGSSPVTVVSVTMPALSFSFTTTDSIPIMANVDYDLPEGGIGGTLIPSTQSSFTEAVIKTGYIKLSIGSTTDIFSDVYIELKNANNSQGRIDPSPDGTYSLAGKTLKPGTAIYLYGAINSTSAVNGKLKAETIVSEIASITVDPFVSDIGNNLTPQVFPINLADIRDWAESVEFSKIGVTIKAPPGTNRVEGQIKVTVTGDSLLDLNPDDLSKVGDDKTIDLADLYTEEPEEVGAEVCFAGRLGDLDGSSPNTKITFTPAFVGNLTIYDINAGAPVVITIEPEPVFKWSKAVVYPNKIIGNGYETNYEFPAADEVPIDFNELFEPLKDAIGDEADKIGLKEAKVYIYIDSSGDLLENMDPKFKLTAFYTEGGQTSPISHTLLEESPVINPGVTAPSFDTTKDTFGGELAEQFPVIDLKDIINANPRPNDFRLKAAVALPTTTEIVRGEDPFVRISPQIVIKLPLSLKIDSTDNGGDGYAVLSLNGLLPDDKLDLLDRDSEDDKEEFLELLENLNLSINYTNRLGLGGMKLVVTIRDGEEPREFELSEGEGGRIDTSLSPEDIKFPFKPKLKLKIPDTVSNDFGLLILKRQSKDKPGFSINSMSVTADMVIDKTY